MIKGYIPSLFKNATLVVGEEDKADPWVGAGAHTFVAPGARVTFPADLGHSHVVCSASRAPLRLLKPTQTSKKLGPHKGTGQSMPLRALGLGVHFSLSCIGEGNGNPLQCSCLENPRDGGAWWAGRPGTPSRPRRGIASPVAIRRGEGAQTLVAQLVKNLPAIWETWVRSLGWEDPLEKGKATHSSILAWRNPWGCKDPGLQEHTP